MTKPKFESPNLTTDNISKIAALFPGAVTEGKVNFDMLRTILGDDVAGDEAYEFTWVGKREAIREAGRPIRKTLRPCVEESKNWDTTENLYIEGDNLDVLKLLQESYLGKIKMIYIDPPYNTGNDFVYRDKFTADKDEYDEEAGVYDEDGDRLFKNTETNGRFHSDWCSMIYPRLVLARNLLRDDGVIFISIDDGEVAQCRKICDEVFGESNFAGQIIWKKKYGAQNDARWFSVSHDYIMVYAKSKDIWRPNLLPRTEEANSRYKNPDDDPRGLWKAVDFSRPAVIRECIYDIALPSGRIIRTPQGRSWLKSRQGLQELIDDNRIYFGANGDSVPSQKRFLSEVKDGMVCQTVWDYSEVGHSDKASKDLKLLLKSPIFDYPKPVDLLKRIVSLTTQQDSIVLDFFSGSATTAHAVMQLNAEDGGKRKFIMVQLPEVCAEGTEAAKAGYKNICEIGKERIRRAGEKIAETVKTNNIRAAVGAVREPPLPYEPYMPDIGFRVLKLDDSNMNDVYYAASDYNQKLLDMMTSNIKDDRTDMDLLYGCLLDWGLPLSMPHTHEEIGGVTVHTYNNGDLIACFADKVSDAVVKEIAKRQPLRAVFRDSSFADSPSKINVEEIFKLLAPNTSVKVI